MEKRKVIVFGIFDDIHDGHRDFFRQAKEYGNELIVIVGRDKIAQQLKDKTPKRSEQERVDLVAKEKLVDSAVLGDEKLSTYSVLSSLNPEVICLGYDQQKLGEDLQNWIQKNKKQIQVHYLKPYQNDTFHNALL
ncbi:adenylyltransferase/cytidyltransferase family protein [Patescibacteria group bacterium]|nr:adenylyltransferase/cytidyltransferase family protein [Patescibacteria group bacterium]